jgi:hypothetical protein
MDIASARIPTIEFLDAKTLQLAEREYKRCLANVVLYNRKDAWDIEGGSLDDDGKRKARVAWIELYMFAKTCLPQLPGGRAKLRRNIAARSVRVERWTEGERLTLWQDAPRRKDPTRADHRRAPDDSREFQKRLDVAARYASLGMPGKAISRLTSEGLAPNTPEVERLMRSKFPAPPAHQATSELPPAPPSDEITEELVIQAVRKFKRGAGAGPSGTRPDFLKQLVERAPGNDIAKVMAMFCTLLANGEAPDELAPYFGGACGYAFTKPSKVEGSSGLDARPVCSGEAWRRVIGGALLSVEGDALVKYLSPHQLAVNIKGGVEVLPHLARDWFARWRDDGDRVIADFDQSNAHNCVDRAAFLRRAFEIIPGAARWLSWIYPLDTATFVFYQDGIIESRSGGQQGCPLIAACHAMVQRAVPESLGLVELAAGTTHLLPVMQPPANLDAVALFADDGIIAGCQQEVLR